MQTNILLCYSESRVWSREGKGGGASFQLLYCIATLSSTEAPLSEVSAGAGKKAAAPAVTLQSGFHNERSIEPLRRREV